MNAFEFSCNAFSLQAVCLLQYRYRAIICPAFVKCFSFKKIHR